MYISSNIGPLLLFLARLCEAICRLMQSVMFSLSLWVSAVPATVFAMIGPYVLVMCEGIYEDTCPEMYSAYDSAVNDNYRFKVAPPQGACPEDGGTSERSEPAKPLT